MIYKFETDDAFEAKQLSNSSDNYFLLWELKNNFWRKWKDEPPKDGYEILDALKEYLEDFKEIPE